MKTCQIEPIGFVVNDFNEPTDHRKIKEKPSTVIIDDSYAEALVNIENCEYLDIVFYFHKSNNARLSGKMQSGEIRGVFASRSPERPNLIGITTVKLLQRDKNKLIVQGLDAINNTPVLDIKCCDTSLFASEADSNPAHIAILKSEPRVEIWNDIVNVKTGSLLLKAGQLHGHFCPGLAMGVMASCYAMNEMKAESDGMEDLLAITETNNCFSDGVQFVTGCSFGNNSLIYKDLGKTAFTLTKRNGQGIRVCSKHETRHVIKEAFPDFEIYYQKVVVEQNHDPELISLFKKTALERAFGTLDFPFEKLFKVGRVKTEIPGYAHIHESVECSECGESVMKTRTIESNNVFVCLSCKKQHYGMLDGNGIH
jgi:tRNA-Thr(GGU) m(6)t(6)A37 methyltransferase TsaA